MKTFLAWVAFGAVAAHEFAHAMVGLLLGGRLRSLAIGADVLYPEVISIVWPHEDGYTANGWTQVIGLESRARNFLYHVSGLVGETFYFGALFISVPALGSYIAIAMGVEGGNLPGTLFFIGMVGAVAALLIAIRNSYYDLLLINEDLKNDPD